MRLLRPLILIALFVASLSFAGSPLSEISVGTGFTLDCPKMMAPPGEFEKFGPRYVFKSEAHYTGKTNIATKRDLKVVTHNMENLNESSGKYLVDNKGAPVMRDGKQVYQYGTLQKTEEAVAGLRRTLDSENPDVVVGIEIGSLHAMQAAFGDKYFMFLVPGNSNRGINIGFMIKKELAADIEVQSYRFLKHDYLGVEEEVFSRDFPVLSFRAPGSPPDSEPVLIIAGVHLKSKSPHVFRKSATEVAEQAEADIINSKTMTDEQIQIRDAARARADFLNKNDPTSFKKRELQVLAMMDVLRGYDRTYGGRVPIFMTGDFNNHIPSFQPIWKADFKDAFAARKLNLLDPNVTGTHSYFPGAYPRLREIEAAKKTLAKQAAENERRLAAGEPPLVPEVDPETGEPKGMTPEKLAALEGLPPVKGKYMQLDAFIALGASASRIQDAHVVEEIAPDGTRLGLPQTYQERITRSSDHRAISMTVDLTRR
jgi:hypothetical protein